MKHYRTTLICALLIGAPACQGFRPEMVQVGATLLTAAAENYGGEYSHEVKMLVSTLSSATQTALSAKQSGAVQAAQEMGGTQAPGTPSESGDMGGMGGGPTESAAAPTIALDVSLLRRVADASDPDRAVEFEDGAVLVDGGGPTGRGDEFRIYVRPNVDCYLYLIAVDATGWVQPLFPSQFPDVMNPVRAGSAYVLPDDAHWYGLDQYKGTEHLYFVATLTPRPDLEAQIAEFAGKERQPPPQARSVGVPSIAEADWVESRGLTGIRPGSVTVIEPTGASSYQVNPTTFSFGVPGADFVLTRHFEHH